MAIENVLLELVDENPFNPRKHYAQNKVSEMANSLREVGLRQVPEGRRIDGRVQLAYGHMRLRGFLQNKKKEPEKWKAMPIDVKEISDEEMFDYAIEENLRRSDITPIEVARCVQSFSEMFPEVQEKVIGARHSMTEANVSNMKRVLRLPEKFLNKIDEGTISFTQGRELLALEGLPNAEDLMDTCLGRLQIGNRSYGYPNTVDGLVRAIHATIDGHFPPLEKEFAGYRYDLVFDTRAANCLQCAKMVRTHPTKSATAHFCTDVECWQKKQAEHREKAAAEAKAKMQAEVIQRAAQTVEAAASADFSQEKLPAERDLETMADGLEAIADERDRQIEEAREKANLERPVGELPCKTCSKGQTCDRSLFYVGDDDSGRFVCDEWEPEVLTKVPTEVPTQEIPDAVLQKAKEAAGTRAEVLDLNDISVGTQYSRQMKSGYVLLSGELRLVDEPEECLERCTHGFHYAFDSKAKEQKEIYVCSDTKCLSKKKGALTRRRHAEGQARKKSEKEAIKQVLDDVGQVACLVGEHMPGILAVANIKAESVAVPRSLLMLIIYNQLHGQQISTWYGGEDTKKPENWLWDKLSCGTPKEKRDKPALWELLGRLSAAELAKLIAEMMFYYLQDHGDVGTYEIKTAKALGLFGIVINDAVKEEVAVADDDDGDGDGDE